MPKVELIETRDGSSSLFLPEMDETYHSTHGALTESQYVFVDKGLNYWIEQNPKKTEVRILEIGFGTGLNAWLTALAVQDSKFNIHYSTLEKFPLETNTISQLNYTKDRNEAEVELFNKLHALEWDKPYEVIVNFVLEKLETDVFDFMPEIGSFDIIYFDAFAPSKQPEMWQPEVLQKMHDSLGQGGLFTTYCAQGQFKRDLRAAGFELEELPGPPGKKEMTRGLKR